MVRPFSAVSTGATFTSRVSPRFHDNRKHEDILTMQRRQLLAGDLGLPAIAQERGTSGFVTLPVWTAPGQTDGSYATFPLSAVGIVDAVRQQDGTMLYCATTAYGQRWFAEPDGKRLIAAWKKETQT